MWLLLECGGSCLASPCRQVPQATSLPDWGRNSAQTFAFCEQAQLSDCVFWDYGAQLPYWGSAEFYGAGGVCVGVATTTELYR